MVKKVTLLMLALVLLAYILFTVFVLNPNAKDMVCKNLEVVVVDTLDRHFVSSHDIATMLNNAGINPVGKNLKEINTETIEAKLRGNELIKRVECYKTMGGNVRIEVHQKIPILRIISSNENYYIDSEGKIMPVPKNFAAYVPIVTGFVSKDFAKTKLYDFALFLQNNKFWNTQIEQIHVAPNQDVELIPRVGNHQIILGKLDDYKENLEKLLLFYDKGLNVVGWNNYTIINLKFKNQVVCTKKDQ